MMGLITYVEHGSTRAMTRGRTLGMGARCIPEILQFRDRMRSPIRSALAVSQKSLDFHATGVPTLAP
jgi:hypothetical protein